MAGQRHTRRACRQYTHCTPETWRMRGDMSWMPGTWRHACKARTRRRRGYGGPPRAIGRDISVHICSPARTAEPPPCSSSRTVARRKAGRASSRKPTCHNRAMLCNAGPPDAYFLPVPPPAWQAGAVRRDARACRSDRGLRAPSRAAIMKWCPNRSQGRS